jgi:hypothetical protein
MCVNSDGIQPLYEVSPSPSKAIYALERDGGEIVSAKSGQPMVVFLNALGMYRFGVMDRLLGELLTILMTAAPRPKLITTQTALHQEVEQPLVSAAGYGQ